MPLRILFITRSYPPIIGGMERFSYHLINETAKLDNVKVTAIVNKRGKTFLPLFIPLALIKAAIQSRKYDIVHLSDAVLAPVGDILKIFFPRLKITTTVHGLDLTYGETNQFYKNMNLNALKSLDKVIAVSQATALIARKAGIKKSKIAIIPNGIIPEEICDQTATRSQLLELIKQKIKPEIFEKLNQPQKNVASPNALEDKVFLLTLGRLAKRKGVPWFLRKVLPKLDQQAIYLIAGGGPQAEIIKKIIKNRELEERALFLGPVTDAERKILFNTTDIFVQPNIKIKGDMEGFGIVNIEAATCGLPVVASKLEGIQEAVTNGKNGILVESGNQEKYINILNELVNQPEKRQALSEQAKEFTLNKFHWKIISERYYQEFKSLI